MNTYHHKFIDADTAERDPRDPDDATDDWEETLRYCEREWTRERNSMMREIFALRADLERVTSPAYLAEAIKAVGMVGAEAVTEERERCAAFLEKKAVEERALPRVGGGPEYRAKMFEEFAAAIRRGEAA